MYKTRNKRCLFFSLYTLILTLAIFCVYNELSITKARYKPLFMKSYSEEISTTRKSTLAKLVSNYPSTNKPITTAKLITTEKLTTIKKLSTTKELMTTKKLPTTKEIVTTKKIITTKKPGPFQCYKNLEKLPTLTDIMDVSPKKGKTIMFVETSCRSREAGKVTLKARQACTIESAALHNPNYEVYLIVASPATIHNTSELNDKLLATVLSYGNVKIHHVNIDRYLKDTPVEDLYNSGRMEKSSWPMIHLSDVMRFVTMWRYGCIYMDLDTMVLKSLEDLEPNFSGVEFKGGIAAGIMSFDHNGKGHEWVSSILEDINKNFRPNAWSYNANGAMNRLIYKICNTSDTSLMTAARCQGFQVFEMKVFYPLELGYWTKFFDPALLGPSLALLPSSRAVHMWNSVSSKKPITVGTNTAYEIIARLHCPKVFSLFAKNSTF